MVKSNRLLMAQVLAGSTLAIALVFFINSYDKSPDISSVRSLGQIGVILAAAAFALSLKIKSVIVAGFLMASGIVGLIPTVTLLTNSAAIMFSGPILGVISYAIISGLGVAKAEGLRNKGINLIIPH